MSEREELREALLNPKPYPPMGSPEERERLAEAAVRWEELQELQARLEARYGPLPAQPPIPKDT